MKKSILITVSVAVLAGGIAFIAIRSFLAPKAPAAPTTEIAPLPGAPSAAIGGLPW